MPKAARHYDTHFGRVPVDPIVTMIDAFRVADAAYSARSEAVEAAGGDVDALAAETYEAPWEALAAAPAATTSAGAIAALDLVLADPLGNLAGDQAEALVRSARDYLARLGASLDAASRCRQIADQPAAGMFRTILSRLLFIGGDGGASLLAFPVETVDLVRIMEIAAQNGVTPAAAPAARWQMLREEAIAYLGAHPEPRHVAAGVRAAGEA